MAHLGRLEIADAEAAELALFVQLVDSAERLLKGRLAIGPVQVCF